MASASFRSVGHVQPALWPRGCYCKHKGTEASACYAKRSGFLRFRIAVLVPILSRCLPVRHIGRCTHWAGTHPLESGSRPLLRSCACSIFRHHGAAPHGGRCTQSSVGRSLCCHGVNFEGSDTFFQRCILGYPSRPCLIVSLWYGRGPKK